MEQGAKKGIPSYWYGIIPSVSHKPNLMPSYPAFAQPVIRAIMTAQRRRQILPRPGKTGPAHVVVGFSGGADSVCLLHALSQLAPAWSLSLHAAHLDHALRPESRDDAEFARQLAAELHIPFHTRRLAAGEVAALAGGLEAAARSLRYAFLAETARSVTPADQQPIVVVAHHMEDQAETVVMNLVTGAGLAGLGGMEWVRPLEDEMSARPVWLGRPLLGVRRAEILAYLSGYGLTRRDDATNQDASRLRNRIRHQTLPLLAEMNPEIVPTLARTAAILAAEAERSAESDRANLAWAIADADPVAGRVVLDAARFRELGVAAQRGVLRQAASALRLDLREAGFDHIEALLWHLRNGDMSGGPHTLAGDVAWTVMATPQHEPELVSLHRSGVLPVRPVHPHLGVGWRDAVGRLALPDAGEAQVGEGWSLHCELVKIEQLPADWRGDACPWRAFVDADAVAQPTLATPAPGMAFCPLGMPGQTKRLGDLFTDRKTPRFLRSGWPLVVNAATGRVAWVCGLALAHDARVSEATRRVRCLTWRMHDVNKAASCAPM